MRKAYDSPKLVVYGRIADNTFTTPGGVKGCQTDCHVDNFLELSANLIREQRRMAGRATPAGAVWSRTFRIEFGL